MVVISWLSGMHMYQARVIPLTNPLYLSVFFIMQRQYVNGPSHDFYKLKKPKQNLPVLPQPLLQPFQLQSIKLLVQQPALPTLTRYNNNKSSLRKSPELSAESRLKFYQRTLSQMCQPKVVNNHRQSQNQQKLRSLVKKNKIVAKNPPSSKPPPDNQLFSKIDALLRSRNGASNPTVIPQSKERRGVKIYDECLLNEVQEWKGGKMQVREWDHVGVMSHRISVSRSSLVGQIQRINLLQNNNVQSLNQMLANKLYLFSLRN